MESKIILKFFRKFESSSMRNCANKAGCGIVSFRSVALLSNHSNSNMFSCNFFHLYYQFLSAHIIPKRRHFWRCLFRFIPSTEFISVSTNQISDVVSLIHISFDLVHVIMLLGLSNGVNFLKKIYEEI